MLFGGQVSNVGNSSSTPSCVTQNDGSKKCAKPGDGSPPQVEEGGVPSWLKYLALTAVTLLSAGGITAAVAMIRHSRRFADKSDAKPPEGERLEVPPEAKPEPAALQSDMPDRLRAAGTLRDRYFKKAIVEAGRKVGIPQKKIDELHREYVRNCMGMEMHFDSPELMEHAFGSAFANALESVFQSEDLRSPEPAPAAIAPTLVEPQFPDPFSEGARTMVDRRPPPLYPAEQSAAYYLWLKDQPNGDYWSAEFDAEFRRQYPHGLERRGSGFDQAMSDAMEAVIAARANVNFGSGSRSGDTVVDGAPGAEGRNLPTRMLPAEAVEFEMSFMRAHAVSVTQGALVGFFPDSQDDVEKAQLENLRNVHKWVTYDCMNFIEQLNANNEFKKLDGSKKVQVGRAIAEGMLVQDGNSGFTVAVHGTAVPGTLIENALSANGIDPANFGAFPEVQVRRDPAAVTVADGLVKEHAAIVKHIESLETAGSGNNNEALRTFMASVPESDRPLVRGAIADCLVSRWNGMSQFQRDQILLSVVTPDVMHGKDLLGKMTPGGIPNLWVNVQVETIRRGDVSDAGLDRVMQRIELRRDATAAMFQHLSHSRYNDLSREEKAMIAGKFGEAVIHDESYRGKYFSDDLRNNPEARGALLASATIGIADAALTESANREFPNDPSRASWRALERTMQMEWLGSEQMQQVKVEALRVRASQLLSDPDRLAAELIARGLVDGQTITQQDLAEYISLNESIVRESIETAIERARIGGEPIPDLGKVVAETSTSGILTVARETRGAPGREKPEEKNKRNERNDVDRRDTVVDIIIDRAAEHSVRGRR